VFVDNNTGRDQAMQTFLAPAARRGVILLPRSYNWSQVDPYLSNHRIFWVGRASTTSLGNLFLCFTTPSMQKNSSLCLV